MKTAEEIYEQMDSEMPFNINNGPKPYILEAMKIYAQHVAEKALKDAASKYEGVHMRDSFGCTCDVPRAITSTPIQTP